MSIQKPYGAWIAPNGKITQVTEQCQHKEYLNYNDASKEGYICIVYGSVIKKSYIPNFFCSRLNPETVTELALKSLLKLVNKADNEEFIFEDIWTNYFTDFTNATSIVDKINARKLIRNIAAGKVKSKQ